MKSKSARLIAATLVAFMAASAQGATIELFDYGFNIDGAVSYPILGDPVPAEADLSAFDEFTGLGTIDITITGDGNHSVLGFFNHDIDVLINDFFNENGEIGGGAPVAGQSWEIDEPYVFGDILTNFENNTLDNINALPIGNPDDVSMAMGFDFALTAGQTATVSLNLSETNNAPGFFLQQIDLDSPADFFFWGDLAIDGGGPIDPPTGLAEPGSLGLMMLGVFSILGLRRRRN